MTDLAVPALARKKAGRVPPDRTHGQRMDALQAANKVRCARARLLRELRAMSTDEGCSVAGGLLLNPPQFLESLPVHKLLASVHYVKDSKVAVMLKRAQVNGMRPIGRLTERERGRLAVAVESQWWRR